MTEEIRRACRLAIDAGYRNIDIDSSTLVDLSKPNVDEEQRENYRRAAELTALIRTLETDGVTVSVGGEIGEVGTQNSTVAELRAYLDGYRRELDARAPGATGISKVSVQTGTSHGGVPLPDGGVAEVKLDFEVLRELGVVAREYGLAGAVQHGASTLPDELFHRFPAVETAEIHLATGFQNALYEHPGLPAGAPSRDRGVVLRATPPTSASPARPTSSSCTRPARRRSGRSRPTRRRSPASTMQSFIGLLVAGHDDAHQRLRRAAAVDPQQHRRRRRDPRHARLRAHPAVLRQ